MQPTSNENLSQFLLNTSNINSQYPTRSFSDFTNSFKSDARLSIHEKHNGPPSTTNYPKQRFTPYQSRYATTAMAHQSSQPIYPSYSNTNLNKSFMSTCSSTSNSSSFDFSRSQNLTEFSLVPTLIRYGSTTSLASKSSASSAASDEDHPVVLLISNLEPTTDENALKYRVFQQLKPITPVISLSTECGNAVRVKVPSKQVNIIDTMLSNNIVNII